MNHIAIGYPDREAWLRQLEHMEAYGVEVVVRGNHGMTHSAYIVDPDGNGIEVLYELPAEVWEGDVNAAMNHFESIPPGAPGGRRGVPTLRRRRAPPSRLPAASSHAGPSPSGR